MLVPFSLPRGLARGALVLPLVALTASAALAHDAPAVGRGPLRSDEIVFLLSAGVSTTRLRTLVERYGVDFEPTRTVLDMLRAAGADPPLLASVQAAGRKTAAAAPSALPPDTIAATTSTATMPPIPSSPSPSPRPSPASSAIAPSVPLDLVTIRGPKGTLAVARYEVTNRQYLAFCARSGRPKPEAPFWGMPDDFPVVNVTWHDAQTFCRWLSLETGRAYRLPTEAEWEHAARGGLERRVYPWGDEPPAGRSCFGTGSLCRVGSFKPNGYGLYDMAGGVAEWCEDVFAKGQKARVVRGGSWAASPSSPELLAIERRDKLDPDKTRNEIGFRVVRDP